MDHFKTHLIVISREIDSKRLVFTKKWTQLHSWEENDLNYTFFAGDDFILPKKAK